MKIHGEPVLEEREKKKAWIDIKSKIMILLLMLIVISMQKTIEHIISYYTITIVLGSLYKVNWKGLIKKALASIPLIVSLSIFTFLSNPSGKTITVYNQAIHYSQWLFALLYFSKSMLLILNTLLLIESEDSFYEIILGLKALHFPNTLLVILLFMYRSFLDLEIEAKNMLEARYTRSYGIKMGTNIYTYQVIGYMIGGLLFRSLVRSQQRQEALYSRAFTGDIPLKRIPWSIQGIFMLWFLTVLSILIILFTISGSFPLFIKS